LLTLQLGALDGLKHGKSDVTEAKKGSECGISLVDWEEFLEGDQIQAIEEIREKRRL
jgi:translation initiation factor IF-2